MIRRVALIVALLSAWFAAGATPAAAGSSIGCLWFGGARFDTPGPDLPITNYKLNGEWIRIVSFCSKRAVIGGWRIQDYGSKNTYVFPADQAIAAGGRITLYTGKGTSDSGHKFWGKTTYVWNNTCPEKEYLRTASGLLYATNNPLHC